jgi:hypothetical protein
MRFEGRDLKPWAEYVPALDLVKGSVYFLVRYLDDDLLIPVLEPVVFVGRDLEPGDDDQVYFQDADSYLHGVQPFGGGDSAPPPTDGPAEATVHSFSAADNRALAYEKAIDLLVKCELRRRERGTPDAR